MTTLSVRDLCSCFPISRSELLDDLTKTQQGAERSGRKVWIVPAHVFLTLNKGNKLLTFDCKPVSYHHQLDSNSLDLTGLASPVKNIFLSPVLQGIVFIILKNGDVHCCQFTKDYRWSPLFQFKLCPANVEIINICIHKKHNALYWCEHRPDETYAICRKFLPDSTEKLQEKKVKQTAEMMLNCLPSDVVALGNGILVVPWYQADQARVCVFCAPSVLEMVSVVLAVGDVVGDLTDMRSPVDFPTVLSSDVSLLAQAGPSLQDLGVKKDPFTETAFILSIDGTVQKFQFTDTGKESLTTTVMKTSIPDFILEKSDPWQFWCVHKNILVIISSHNKIVLHSLLHADMTEEIVMGDNIIISALATVESPGIIAVVVSNSGLYVIQGSKLNQQRNPNDLPTDRHFQTDALHVAQLNQLREEQPSRAVSDQLEAFHKKWQDVQTHPPRSTLSDLVDGYLAEFWRLEEMTQSLRKREAVQSLPPLTETDIVKEAVSRCRFMAPDAGAAELLWLSKKYPTTLLEVLLENLDVDNETLTQEDHDLWQATVGLEEGESHVMVPSCPMTFEIICRLLYVQRPHSLVPFVRNTQQVSEQAVGVSAFVRRKHTLQYYVRAMECLPDPEESQDPEVAAAAKAEIILLGETEHAHERALRFLLRHSKWSQAVHLLQSLGQDRTEFTLLYFLLLQEFVQKQILSDYANEVFCLLPSWKSFLSVAKVIADGPDASLYSSMAATSPSVFYSGHPDIPFSAVQPHLVGLLRRDASH